MTQRDIFLPPSKNDGLPVAGAPVQPILRWLRWLKLSRKKASFMDHESDFKIESESANAIAFFICRYFGVLTALLLILLSGFNLTSDLGLIVVGVLIDLFRRKFSPDLTLSTKERQIEISMSVNNNMFKRQFNQKFFYRTSLIYWFWWLISFSFFLPALLHERPIAIPNFLLSCIDFAPFKTYLILNDNTLMLSAFPNVTECSVGKQYLAFTWDVMLIAFISEITGGAFFYSSKDILYVKRTISLKRLNIGRGSLHACGVIIAIILLYQSPALFSWLSIMNPNNSIHNANGTIRLGFMIQSIVMGVSLLGTSGALRFLYLNFLYRISGGFKSFLLT